MNWEQILSSLRNPKVKRIRKSVSNFNASFHNTEVPLGAAIPRHGGLCRRPLPYDYLYIVGTTEEGKEETILCGLYSPDLLKAISEQIEKQNSEQAGAGYPPQSVGSPDP